MGLSLPGTVFELAAVLGVLLTPVLVGGFVLWVGFGATLLVGGAILAGSRRRPVRLPAATGS